VRFFFPVAQDEDRARAFEPDITAFRPEEVDAARPTVILVVEDEEAIAFIAEESLHDIGYKAVVAQDADEALRCFDELEQSGGVDLVFSDVVIPGIRNGLALSHEIRARNADVPILMITGYSGKMSIDGPQPEAPDVLGKPYRRRELVEGVQAALRRRDYTGASHQRSDFGHAKS
jgi:DNA-binding response OmpR family regulator